MNSADFFNMGGYALYVWGSFGLAFIALVAEVVSLIRRRRTLLRNLSLIARSRANETDETKA